jgi:hypothetical protein
MTSPKLPRTTTSAAPTLLLLLCCGAAALASSPPADRVVNGDAPDHARQTLVLEEQWRRGGEDDDLFFGLVTDALAGDDGLFYLLDSQLNEVVVLDADGEQTATLGREGEGPGEFRNVGALVWMPDGDLGVVQRFPGRIVKLTRDGMPAGNVLPSDPTAGGRDLLRGARSVGDGLVLCGAHMTRGESSRTRRYFLSLYGPDHAAEVEYLGKDDTMDFSARSVREVDGDFLGDGRWDVTPEGRVVAAAERDRYALTVYDPSGAPLIEFTRPAEPPLRSAETLETLETRYKRSRLYQRGVMREYSPSDPMIRVVDARPDGEIWVLPTEGTRPGDDGVFQTWDVFTADGRWDRRVALRCAGDPERDRLFLLDGGRALLVSGFQNALDALRGEETDDDSDDAEPMEVILYRIR